MNTVKLTSEGVVMYRKSAEGKMRRRGAMVTERRERGSSALCEEIVVEHGRCRSGACGRRRRCRLCQKRQHSSSCCCIFPLPIGRLDSHLRCEELFSLVICGICRWRRSFVVKRCWRYGHEVLVAMRCRCRL